MNCPALFVRLEAFRRRGRGLLLLLPFYLLYEFALLAGVVALPFLLLRAVARRRWPVSRRALRAGLICFEMCGQLRALSVAVESKDGRFRFTVI